MSRPVAVINTVCDRGITREGIGTKLEVRRDPVPTAPAIVACVAASISMPFECRPSGIECLSRLGDVARHIVRVPALRCAQITGRDLERAGRRRRQHLRVRSRGGGPCRRGRTRLSPLTYWKTPSAAVTPSTTPLDAVAEALDEAVREDAGRQRRRRGRGRRRREVEGGGGRAAAAATAASTTTATTTAGRQADCGGERERCENDPTRLRVE